MAVQEGDGGVSQPLARRLMPDVLDATTLRTLDTAQNLTVTMDGRNGRPRRMPDGDSVALGVQRPR